MTGFMPIESLDQFTDEIEREKHGLDLGQSSYVFALVADHARTPVKLSADQAEISGRLDQLNRDILAAWLSRNLHTDSAPKSDQEAAEWFNAWNRRRNSFIAQSEALLLEGILSAVQAESFLVIHWRNMGPLALADPDLARTLKLSSAQRSEIAEAFITRESIMEQVTVLGSLVETGTGRQDEWGRNVSAVAKEEKVNALAEANWTVWSILTPSQRRKLSELLGADISALQPPAVQTPKNRIVPRRSTRAG